MPPQYKKDLGEIPKENHLVHPASGVELVFFYSFWELSHSAVNSGWSKTAKQLICGGKDKNK